MIFPRALWTAGSVLPSDTRCSRKGFSSFSLLRFSTCAPAAQHEHMIAIYQVPQMAAHCCQCASYDAERSGLFF